MSLNYKSIKLIRIVISRDFNAILDGILWSCKFSYCKKSLPDLFIMKCGEKFLLPSQSYLLELFGLFSCKKRL